MDSSIPSGPGVRPDVVTAETAPRPTARTVGAPFSEVLAGGARAFVRGATVAARAIPGSPLMAVAVRNGPVTTTMPVSTALPEGPGAVSGYTGPIGLGSGVVSGGGMGAAVGVGAANPANIGALGGGVAASSGASTGDGSLDSVMAQDQEMNLYYLQIQEQVNAQNRTYSALSNVIEVEHNTAKTAIGNIH
jgi:hypothetical protein